MVGLLNLVLFFIFFDLVHCDLCDPNHGTEGIYDCVRMPRYAGYQWAICLSSQSLRTQTSGQITCQGSLFCWLPCMQSIYPNSKGGYIAKECKCDPAVNERRITKRRTLKLKVPSVCYIPAWTINCQWYSKCLEAHSPCEGSNFNYAISYGEAICSIFQQGYNSFSEVGKSWISSSQKCIEDLMRSVLMPNNTAKCKDIRDFAYEVNIYCFIQRSDPHFCKLSSTDQLKIYWSIKQVFEHAFSEKYNEAMARIRPCIRNYLYQEQRKFIFYLQKNVGQYVDENTFASKVAEKFNFFSHGLDWDVDNTFSSTQKQFYITKEYQVVEMFVGKRQVEVKKKRKRSKGELLLKISDIKYDTKSMDNFMKAITVELRINNQEELTIGSAKLIGIAEKLGDPWMMDVINFFFPWLTHSPRIHKNIQINFFLYDKSRRSIQMEISDTSSFKQFDPNKITFVIVHGFKSSGKAPWVVELRDSILDKEDANVIVVDWSSGADLSFFFYSQAAANTKIVGENLALLVANLEHHRKATETYFHIIGHSLGAHVAGFAGSVYKDTRINRITGLDPAGPIFNDKGKDERLDKTDAHFVDVIHTNGGSLFPNLGYKERLGHVDFYPNGGSVQPECTYKWEVSYGLYIAHPQKGEFDSKIYLPLLSDTCSHSKAYDFFIDSILSDQNFKAYKCQNLNQCTSGKGINAIQSTNTMGFYAHVVDEPTMYYLKTTKESHAYIP